MGVLIFLVAVVAIAVIVAVNLYNRLVTLRNCCKNTYTQIDAQLQRRYELNPQLS
jgi:LemA protein